MREEARFQKGEKIMEKTKDPKSDFLMYCLVGIILSSIRRNGLGKTLEDLRNNCRSAPESDEDVYQDLLKVLNGISDKRGDILKIRKGVNKNEIPKRKIT